MAICIWRGDGVARPQTITRTISGTWASGEEISISINGKVVTLVVGEDTEPEEIANLIAQAWNGEMLTDSAAEVSPLTGGGLIPEYQEITAQTSGAKLTLFANVAGKPFDDPTLTTDSDLGDLGSWSTEVASAGPNHWNTPENWEDDALPANGDTVIVPEGNISILYGLDQSTVTLAELVIEQGFTGQIGLPVSDVSGYREYRDTYLKIGATAIYIGNGNGQGSQRLQIDTGAAQTTLNIVNSGYSDQTPAILWKGAHGDNVVNINKGSVGLASLPGEVSTVDTIRIGYISNPDGDATVQLGSGVTLGELEMSGGVVTLRSDTALITQTGGTLSVERGTHTEINQDGGTCFYASVGTLSTARIGNGSTLDFSRDMRSKTVSACEVYASGSLLDPFGVVSFASGIDVVRTSLDRVTINLGSHFTITPTAI